MSDHFQKLNNESKDISIEVKYFNNSEEYVLLKLTGFLDTYNSDDFSRAVVKFLEKKDRKILVIDISSVNYMSSTGIGAFTALNKYCHQSNIKLYILGIQKNVKEVFSLLGFQSFFSYIDELKDIKEEKIKRSKFPIKIKCPYCEASLVAQKTGSFKCKRCENIFRLTEKNDKINIEKRS